MLGPFNEPADDPVQVRWATRELLRDGADVIRICATGSVNTRASSSAVRWARSNQGLAG
ncbi:hypothetical protein [Streptomyces sp. JNUCC 63]